MDEELLISLVKERGELYDPEHRYYQDKEKRTTAWRDIAKKMMSSPHECRERWKKLRENYRKAMKLRQAQMAKGIKKLKAVKHGKIMAFLDIREQMSDTQNAELSTIPKFERHVQEGGELDPLNDIETDEPTTKSDTIVSFFTNLGETVKTFPEDVQIRVKRDIFKIINEAEEEVLMSRTKVRRVVSQEYIIDY